MRPEAQRQYVDFPDGYSVPPVLSLGVAQLVAFPEANWDDRLWDVVVRSDGEDVRKVADGLWAFWVCIDRGLPGERVDQLIRHDVEGSAHLYLLEEWNETRRPFILLPSAA